MACIMREAAVPIGKLVFVRGSSGLSSRVGLPFLPLYADCNPSRALLVHFWILALRVRVVAAEDRPGWQVQSCAVA